MGDAAVTDVMDEMEQRAEERMKLLTLLDTAQMMRVTRDAILEWIEDERRRDRQMFGALSS